MSIEVVFPGGQQVDALMGNHRIITQQDNSAPSPFAYFLASIATCAGIYVLGFCQQRGLPTEGLRIIQDMERNPATGMIDHISIDIELPPNFPDKYKEAVIRSAQLCAVKKHMETPPEFSITTSVAELV